LVEEISLFELELFASLNFPIGVMEAQVVWPAILAQAIGLFISSTELEFFASP